MDEQKSIRPAPAPGALDFLWIEDEGLLRDEGVVFGLAGDRSALEFKEAAIRAYFGHSSAESERKRTALEAQIAEIRRQEELCLRADGDAVGMRDGLTRVSGDDAPLATITRYGAGMAAAVLATVGTGVLVFELLAPSFANSGAVTLGVVCAAFFTAFLPVSILFAQGGAQGDGDVEPWKVWSAEIGLPIVAALFVTTWSWDTLTGARAVALALFLFLVFVFTGRQFLSSIPRLGRAVVAARVQMERQREVAEVLAAHQRRAADRLAFDERLSGAAASLASLRSRAEWEAIRDAKIALFRSEFELAATRAAHGPAEFAPSAVSTNGNS